MDINSNFGKKRVFCAAQMVNSFLIHPNGKLYKCANNYNEEHSIGFVHEKGFYLKKDWKTCNPFVEEQCKNCEIIAYCNGGCSYARQRVLLF